MPIFEYKCKSCNKTFEKLITVNKTSVIKCPFCNSAQLEKQFSAFSSPNTAKLSCPAQTTCESLGSGCCGSKCPMH